MTLDRRIVALYDEYTHKPLGRRDFLDRLAVLTGSAAAATAALAALEPNCAQAQIVAPDAARIVTMQVAEMVGGAVNRLAVSLPDLAAGVVFYGVSPRSEDVAAIGAAMQLHYAGRDERINAGVPPYEAALKAAGKRYEVHMYPNVDHAFNNDTSAERFDKAAADLAWNRTLAFFRKELAVPLRS